MQPQPLLATCCFNTCLRRKVNHNIYKLYQYCLSRSRALPHAEQLHMAIDCAVAYNNMCVWGKKLLWNLVLWQKWNEKKTEKMENEIYYSAWNLLIIWNLIIIIIRLLWQRSGWLFAVMPLVYFDTIGVSTSNFSKAMPTLSNFPERLSF